MLVRKIFILLLILLFETTINAQLTVDPTFNSTDHGGGKQNGVFGGESSVDHALILPNGQILVGGFYGIMHNKTNQCLSLLNADGTIDPSFNAPGIKDDLGDGVTAMALQPDGKIVLGGTITIYHGQKVYDLVRANANGDLDASFNTGTGFYVDGYQKPHSIVIQPDGKIILGGDFTTYNGSAVTGLIRLNADGSLDNSFNFLSDSVTTINKIILRTDGKIIIGGMFKIHSDNSYKNLARLNADGSLDAAFKVDNSIPLNPVLAFDMQKNSQIVFSCDSSVYRVNNDGTIDAGFIKGIVSNALIDATGTRIRDIKVQTDGKILLAGGITLYNNIPHIGILRLNTDGSIDNSFSTGTGFGGGEYGGEVDNRIEEINLFSDGRIFINGGFLFYRGVWQGTMAELNSDGSINTIFNSDNGNGADANVNKMAVQPDNKILIAGYFDTYNGVNRNKLARLNIGGTLDNTFNAGTGPDSCNFLNTVVLQKDGKILVGGNFAKFNNVAKSYIVRLNTDGSLDNSFSFTALTKKYGDVTDGVKAIAIQNDGKIIIGFDEIDNHITSEDNSNVVMRLNADGSVDNGFNVTAFNNSNEFLTIYSIRIQNDGKILVAGDFELDNINKRNLIRLNADGSLDAAFNTAGNGPNSVVYSVNVQSDNKIIISGEFDSYNSTASNILARLNTDGSLDAGYSPVIPDVIDDLDFIIIPVSYLDSGNKILLSYVYYSDTTYGRVLRYNTNGSIDNTFGTNNKTDFLVSDMALQNDKLLLGGFIQSFNGVNRNHITRTTTPEALPVKLLSFTAQKQNKATLLQWQTANEVNNNYFSVERSPDFKLFTSIGKKQATNKASKSNYVFVDNAPLAGMNYYRLKQVDGDGKFIYSNIVSVDFSSNASVFAVYPNPVSNVLNITLPSINKTSDIILYDATGKEVMREQLASNINRKQINISRLPAGVYNIVLVQDSKQQLIKIVKK